MSAQKIATRYAKSILDIAKEKGKEKEIFQDFKDILQSIKSSKDLRLVLKSPIVKADKKNKILQAVFQSKIDDITLSFIAIVVRKKREMYLGEIAQSYINAYYKLNQIQAATLITVAPITSTTRNQIEKSVGNLELTSKVDPSILGGYVLKFDDKLLDASVVRSLEKIKQRLLDDSYERKL